MTPDDYDPRQDLTRGIEECYRAIRARVAAGGPAWTPKADWAATRTAPPSSASQRLGLPDQPSRQNR